MLIFLKDIWTISSLKSLIKILFTYFYDNFPKIDKLEIITNYFWIKLSLNNWYWTKNRNQTGYLIERNFLKKEISTKKMEITEGGEDVLWNAEQPESTQSSPSTTPTTTAPVPDFTQEVFNFLFVYLFTESIFVIF